MAMNWRSNLKSPRQQTSSAVQAQKTLTSPRERLSNFSPRQETKPMASPRDEKNIVKSRWSYLSASSTQNKSPRKDVLSPRGENKLRITADELIARKFSPEKKPVARQRSQGFLKAVQKFEGEIPGKLIKKEEARKNLADEQLEFCSNELVDMREFLEQIEVDFSVIRQRIDKAKEGVSDLRRSNRNFFETG